MKCFRKDSPDADEAFKYIASACGVPAYAGGGKTLVLFGRNSAKDIIFLFIAIFVT